MIGAHGLLDNEDQDLLPHGQRELQVNRFIVGEVRPCLSMYCGRSDCRLQCPPAIYSSNSPKNTQKRPHYDNPREPRRIVLQYKKKKQQFHSSHTHEEDYTDSDWSRVPSVNLPCSRAWVGPLSHNRELSTSFGSRLPATRLPLRWPATLSLAPYYPRVPSCFWFVRRRTSPPLAAEGEKR